MRKLPPAVRPIKSTSPGPKLQPNHSTTFLIEYNFDLGAKSCKPIDPPQLRLPAQFQTATRRRRRIVGINGEGSRPTRSSMRRSDRCGSPQRQTTATTATSKPPRCGVFTPGIVSGTPQNQARGSSTTDVRRRRAARPVRIEDVPSLTLGRPSMRRSDSTGVEASFEVLPRQPASHAERA